MNNDSSVEPDAFIEYKNSLAEINASCFKNGIVNLSLLNTSHSIGLLYGCLTTNDTSYWNALVYISNDNLKLASNLFISILSSNLYLKLKSKLFAVKFLDSLIQANASNVNDCLYFITRQIRGSDCSSENLSMISGLMSVLERRIDWFLKLDFMLQGIAVYSIMRLVCDHTSEELSNVRNGEVSFLVKVLRKNVSIQLFYKNNTKYSSNSSFI